jgi:hypothetical protein
MLSCRFDDDRCAADPQDRLHTKEPAEPLVAAVRGEISALDDKFIGETVGVAHAMDEMRKAFAEIDACLDRREYEQAAALGYGWVSSAFVFLQRTLRGLQGLCMEKQVIVQDLAAKLRCAYEEALPHVDAVMVSARRKETDAQRSRECAAGGFRLHAPRPRGGWSRS